MKLSGGKSVPEEKLKCWFILKNGESFSVTKTKVDVDYAESPQDHREGREKRWTVEMPTRDREIYENEVETCIVSLKEKFRDEADELPPGPQ